MEIPDKYKSKTPKVLILMDSHGHRLDTNKVCRSTDVYKQTTYELKETENEIQNLKSSPKVLCLQVGTNDLLKDTKNIISNMKNTIEFCKQKAPGVHLIVGAIPPLRNENLNSLANNANREIENFCSQLTGVTFVCHSNIKDCESRFLNDGIHLSAQAFFKLADKLTRAIEKAVL